LFSIGLNGRDSSVKGFRRRKPSEEESLGCDCILNPYSKENEVRMMKMKMAVNISVDVRKVRNFLRIRFLAPSEKAATMALRMRMFSIEVSSLVWGNLRITK
jgi:hypothetical protein